MTFSSSFLFSQERLEEGRAWQDELRQKYGTRPLTPAITELQYALRCESAVRQNILAQQGDEDALNRSYARLAELLMEIGNFDEAVEVATLVGDEGLLKRATSLRDALAMDDDAEHCDCLNHDLNSGLSNNFVRRHFMINGQQLSEVACAKCGKSNIRHVRDGDVSTREHENKANNK